MQVILYDDILYAIRLHMLLYWHRTTFKFTLPQQENVKHIDLLWLKKQSYKFLWWSVNSRYFSWVKRQPIRDMLADDGHKHILCMWGYTWAWARLQHVGRHKSNLVVFLHIKLQMGLARDWGTISCRFPKERSWGSTTYKEVITTILISVEAGSLDVNSAD